MKKSWTTLVVGAVALASAATPAVATVQILSFGGTLDYGSNNSSSSTFSAEGTNLGGKTYSVTLSYDPSQFTGTGASSCGTAPNTSCSFYFSSARPLSETITVGNTTRTFQITSGSIDLSSSGTSGPDGFGFNFNIPGSLSLSGYFQDGNGFFPNQSSVNQPIFSNFSNLAVTTGTFQQNGTGYSFGDNPTSLSASYTAAAVPEPASWAMMIGGFGLIGGVLRRRHNANVRFA